jgi:hypothetical protein
MPLFTAPRTHLRKGDLCAQVMPKDLGQMSSAAVLLQTKSKAERDAHP